MAKTNNADKNFGSFDEALKVLDEALEGEPSRVIEGSTQFAQEMKTFARDAAVNAVASLGVPGIDARVIDQAIERLSEAATQAAVEQLGEARAVARRADQAVRANPWPWIGGIAVGTFALGFLLARSQAQRVQQNPSAAGDQANTPAPFPTYN